MVDNRSTSCGTHPKRPADFAVNLTGGVPWDRLIGADDLYGEGVCLCTPSILASVWRLDRRSRMQRERPTGVTILAILAIIGGVFGLCGGGLGLLGGAIAGSGALATSGVSSTDTAALASDAGVLTALSIGLLVLSVLYIIFGIGAF